MKKGQPVATSIDEYLAAVPEPARTTLQNLRATIRSVLPKEATEVISYGMPAVRYKGPLLYFSAFAKHCSFFPGNASLIAECKSDLKNYKTSKGTIQFPLDKPLPTGLVKKLVKARVAENDQKQKR